MVCSTHPASARYRFVIQAGDTLIMDVDAALYRATDERIGIAPDHMYLFGQNDRRADYDWRPQIHDSDVCRYGRDPGGIWRPLMNPSVLRTNSLWTTIRAASPDAARTLFSQYEMWRVLREAPVVWVEPRGHWGAARSCCGDPTLDETFDNIVAFWNPAEKPKRARSCCWLQLYWCRENRCPRARHGTCTHRHRRHRRPEARLSPALRDRFAGGDFDLLGEHANVSDDLRLTRQVEITSARPFRELNGCARCSICI